MTDPILALDFNGVKIQYDQTTMRLVELYGSTVNGTTTMVDVAGGAQYQVPTGKKARIIYITELNGAPTQPVFYADNLDGTTNAVNLIVPATLITNSIFISISIPAAKYVNLTDNGVQVYRMTLLEEDV